jgi:hypothetical protein
VTHSVLASSSLSLSRQIHRPRRPSRPRPTSRIHSPRPPPSPCPPARLPPQHRRAPRGDGLPELAADEELLRRHVRASWRWRRGPVGSARGWDRRGQAWPWKNSGDLCSEAGASVFPNLFDAWPAVGLFGCRRKLLAGAAAPHRWQDQEAHRALLLPAARLRRRLLPRGGRVPPRPQAGKPAHRRHRQLVSARPSSNGAGRRPHSSSSTHVLDHQLELTALNRYSFLLCRT